MDEVFGATRIQVVGDDQSMLFIPKTARSPTMRPLARTPRFSVAWLHALHLRANFELLHVTTDGMTADAPTTSIPVPLRWAASRKLIYVAGSRDE